jgi:hypothetical protein
VSGVSLLDDLRDPDENVRLVAVRTAVDEDAPEVVAALLTVALTDRAEVRTGFGLNDDVEVVGENAAWALRAILARRPGIEPQLRAAAAQPEYDDEQVGHLLRILGSPAEQLRQDFAASPVDRLRLRALKAVPLRDRTLELTTHFVADPSPAVRAEAILAAPEPMTVEAMLGDPDVHVRRAAGNRVRHSAPLLVALRVETDPLTKAFLVRSLSGRTRDEGVLTAVVGCLTAEPRVRYEAAGVLYRVDDPGVVAAIATRILVEDGRVLHNLLRCLHLMTYVPELRGLLARMLRHAPDDSLRFYLSRALERPNGPPPPADPAAGLDPGQRARLRRWAAGNEPTRLAHRLAAVQIRAGLDPLPFLPGEDPGRLAR